MNPQRLVAAVAAMAIGFGVTLAGVIAADDTADPIPTQEQVVGAEQDEEPAVAPEPAQAEPAQADEVSNEAGAEQPPADAPSQEAPSQEAPPQPPQDTGDADCDVAYVVIGVEGDLAVLTSDEVSIGSDGRVFLPGADVSLDELSNIAQIQVRVAAPSSDDEGVFVDCNDDTVIAERNANDLLDEIERLLDAAGDDERPVSNEAASLGFPCGDPLLRAIERTYIEQFGLEVDADTDYDVVLVTLAQRVTAVSVEFDNPENDLSFWVDALQGPFTGFRIDGETDQACALLAENLAPATSTREGFFCGVGQLASDGELLEFLDGLVPLPVDCAYGTSTSGGIGSIRDENDQGEN